MVRACYGCPGNTELESSRDNSTDSQKLFLLCAPPVLQVPETLQYRVVRAMSRHDLTVLSTMAEAPGILQAKPRFTGG
jgi:hypothetical protein